MIKSNHGLDNGLDAEPLMSLQSSSCQVDMACMLWRPGGGGVLPYMGYTGMCHCEGYGFQAVYSRIGHINQNIWVQNRVS